MQNITIGITDCPKYDNYHRWFSQEEGVKIIRLSPEENNLNDLPECDGILLSGGEDVHPRLYNRPDLLPLCDEIDEQRDAFEWKVLDHTEQRQLPLLGICRGLQVVNVYFGGTLFPDIPRSGKFDHSMAGALDRYHQVQIDSSSRLRTIIGGEKGEVNSAHHQSADQVGKGLIANALSPDGVVEGLELRDKGVERFLLLVQWHPERMTNLESPFSRNIKLSFIEAIRVQKNSHQYH